MLEARRGATLCYVRNGWKADTSAVNYGPMTERYEPPSDFLKDLMFEDVVLAGSEEAETRLRRLIELTSDDQPANRDWATLLLSQQDIDTPEVRAALLRAAEDENEYVRGEAIVGLAERDKTLALPLLQRELAGRFATLQVFEAAAMVAHPSLAESLRTFIEPSDDEQLDRLALEAFHACGGTEP